MQRSACMLEVLLVFKEQLLIKDYLDSYNAEKYRWRVRNECFSLCKSVLTRQSTSCLYGRLRMWSWNRILVKSFSRNVVCLHYAKNYITVWCIFFENLLPYSYSRPHLMWCYWRSHLTSLYHHVGIKHCRKIQSTSLGVNVGLWQYFRMNDVFEAVHEYPGKNPG